MTDWSMLPNDVLRLVMRIHSIDYHAREHAIREAHRACMHQLNTLFVDMRMHFHRELMGIGLDPDEADAELDEWIVPLGSAIVLEWIFDPRA
jgi:hypothetical protein